METFDTVEQLKNHLINIVDNIALGEKTELPKYAEYGYDTITIYNSSNEYFVILTQPATSDHIVSYKTLGSAKRYAKKLLINF